METFYIYLKTLLSKLLDFIVDTKFENFRKIPLLIALFGIESCKSRQSTNASTAKGIQIESDQIFENDGRRPVLIYLANNTQIMDIADDSKGGLIPRKILEDHDANLRNWQNFGDPIWKKLVLLREKVDEKSDISKKLKKIIVAMTDDALSFHKVVANESKILRSLPLQRGTFSGNNELTSVIFSNSVHIIYNEHFQYQGEDGPLMIVGGKNSELVQPALNISRYVTDKRLALHPIADRGGLARIFEVIRQELPPDQYKYILIIKSHGSSQLLLTTKFNLDISQLSDNELMRLIEKADRAIENENSKAIDQSKEGLGPDELLAQNFPATLARNINAEKIRDKVPQIGMAKEQFIDFMNEQGKRYGMVFPIVVLESCNSRLSNGSKLGSENLINKNPLSSVGALYTSDERGLSFKTFDYEYFFRTQSQKNPKDFVKNFKIFIDTAASR